MDKTIENDLVFNDKEYKNEIGSVYAKSNSLTKREYFAAMAMQGLLTRTPKRHNDETDLGVIESNRIAEEAVIMAKKLINALNNTK